MELLCRYYQPGTCWSCYMTPLNMQLCEGCHGANYCNEECQNAHWKAHKQFCQFTTNIREEFLAILKTNPKDAVESTRELELFLEIKFIEHHLPRLTVTRPPYSFLHDPRFWLKSMAKLSNEHYSEKVTYCLTCIYPFRNHRSTSGVQLHSSTSCVTVQFLNKCLFYARRNTLQLPKLNEEAYVERLSEKDITNFAQLYIDCDIVKNIPKLGVYTEIISSPLSLIYAIQQIPKVYLEETSDEFVIHIFGAWYNRELNEMDIWKHCFLRFLSPSRNVRLVFVGLHVTNEILESLYWVESGIFLKTKYTFEILHMTYHDYVCSTHHVTPNLLALLDNSISDHADSKWLCKLQLKIPIIIATKYTLMFTSDLNLPSQRKVISINSNPFSSLLPIMCQYLLSDINKNCHTFFYLNKNIMIIVDK